MLSLLRTNLLKDALNSFQCLFFHLWHYLLNEIHIWEFLILIQVALEVIIRKFVSSLKLSIVFVVLLDCIVSEVNHS